MSETAAKLEPCPGCGGEDVQVAEWMADGGMTEVAYVRCSDCGTTGPHVEVAACGDVEAAKAEAEARWNALPRERAWIPVAERLPDVNEDGEAEVLYARGSIMTAARYIDGEWYMGELDPRSWPVDPPTHWMPFPPPPPKREEAADE